MSGDIVLFRPVRGFILLAALAMAAFVPFSAARAAASLPATAEILSERVLGNPDEPVPMVEYASLTCPHCANFAKETLPGVKKDYIDTGKVKLIYRDFPLDNLALRASMMARCAPKERYFGLIETLFATQANWARSSDPSAALQRLGSVVGLNAETYEACVTNREIFDGIVAMRDKAEKEQKVKSTPAFLVDGRMVTGDLSLSEFRKALDSALAAKGQK
jgi:protein-disulfide isomerase